MSTAALSHLSDRDLLAEVSRLATGQRDATVSLIAHLAELHARRLHQRAGFSSLYTYCLEELHLSESSWDAIPPCSPFWPPVRST